MKSTCQVKLLVKMPSTIWYFFKYIDNKPAKLPVLRSIDSEVKNHANQRRKSLFRAIGGLGLAFCDFSILIKGRSFLNELNVLHARALKSWAMVLACTVI